MEEHHYTSADEAGFEDSPSDHLNKDPLARMKHRTSDGGNNYDRHRQMVSNAINQSVPERAGAIIDAAR